jgi:F0F1-type ATP synthase membrane subunit c/vacuolar-type H+-ATPase subunit K
MNDKRSLNSKSQGPCASSLIGRMAWANIFPPGPVGRNSARNLWALFLDSMSAMTSKSKVNIVVPARQPAVPKKLMCIGFILFGIPSAILASYKGFKPLRWLLAFGAIGLIVVCCLSSAKVQGISADEAASRAAKADNIGAIMCGINLALGAVSLLIILSHI